MNGIPSVTQQMFKIVALRQNVSRYQTLRALNTAKPLEPENRDFLFPDVGIREQPTAELNAVTTRRKIQKVEYEMRVHKIGKSNSD